jgi:hypothetical protein
MQWRVGHRKQQRVLVLAHRSRRAVGVAAGVRRGATLAAELEFKLGEGGHHSRYGSIGRCGGVDAFSYGAQRDSSFAEVGDGAGDFSD